MTLTRKQISKIEAGRETDALIGKLIMGMHEFVPNKDKSCKICGCIVFNSIHLGYGPRFSEDMNDAWQVVDKIKDRGKKEMSTHDGINHHEYQHHFHIEWLSEKREWQCGFYDFRYDQWQSIEIEDPTAPLAICKAALLTISKDYTQ